MFKNFCYCNAAVSDLYDSKSKNKIAVFVYKTFKCKVINTIFFSRDLYF